MIFANSVWFTIFLGVILAYILQKFDFSFITKKASSSSSDDLEAKLTELEAKVNLLISQNKSEGENGDETQEKDTDDDEGNNDDGNDDEGNKNTRNTVKDDAKNDDKIEN